VGNAESARLDDLYAEFARACERLEGSRDKGVAP
jgi:hypothetical protein